MSKDSYLQAYLGICNDWPLSLISIDAQKHAPMFASAALFETYYPTQSHDEFLKWRHHRRFNSWQDDIYWMSDTVFQYHWPLIAGALAEVKSSD